MATQRDQSRTFFLHLCSKNFLSLQSLPRTYIFFLATTTPQNYRLVLVPSSSSIPLAVPLCSAPFDLLLALERKKTSTCGAVPSPSLFRPHHLLTFNHNTFHTISSAPFYFCELKLTSSTSAETLLLRKAWIPTVLLPKAAAATTVSDLALSPSFLNATPHFELLNGGHPLRLRSTAPHTTCCGVWKYSKAIYMLPNYLANGCPPLASLKQNLAKHAEWADGLDINPRRLLSIFSSVKRGATTRP